MPVPILSTDLGIFIFSILQPSKAHFLITLRFLGNFMLLTAVLLNALIPIVFKEFGNITVFRFLQSLNASSGNQVTPSFTMTFLIDFWGVPFH